MRDRACIHRYACVLACQDPCGPHFCRVDLPMCRYNLMCVWGNCFLRVLVCVAERLGRDQLLGSTTLSAQEVQ